LDGAKQDEIDDFLKTKFSPDILNLYIEYINGIKELYEQYLKPFEDSDEILHSNFFELKSVIIEELILLSNNLLNLSLNGRNAKRFAKASKFLNSFLENVRKVQDQTNQLQAELKKSLRKISNSFDNNTYLWIEANRIKNLSFRFNFIPENLEIWEEINDFKNYLEKINELHVKKKKKKKEVILTFYFNDIFQFYLKKQDGLIEFYNDLLFFMFLNKFFVEYEEGYFLNVLERKGVKNKLKIFISPIINNLSKEKLKEIVEEITRLKKEFDLTEDDKKINLNKLFDQDFKVFIPKIVKYYFNGLEKKYQEIINNVGEPIEFKSIIKYYTEKIEIFEKKIEEIERYITKFEDLLKPYSILSSFKKTIDNIQSEMIRRKNEYIYYLKTIKKERLRENIRNYVSEKIKKINEFISDYQDKTALIIREEFPQLKKIREILTEYKEKIQQLKEEVYNKLNSFKKKDIDIYQIIKLWEDNFNRKQQQVKFLLSTLLNKIFKSFKDLIEKEEILFESITEINIQKEHDTYSLPLNFALSNVLADKLTEEELNERVSEINSKINHLNQEISLYQEELSKLEDILSTKVKIREGILLSDVQCTICHKKINFAKEKIIKCPFCEAVYHYLCVAFWLSKYNSCPACQNQFLDPNLGMFEEGE